MADTKYADEGTCAHALAAMCLTEDKDASAYVGRLIEMEDYPHAKLSPSSAARWMRCPGSYALELREEFIDRFYSMEVTDEMAADVQIYVDAVRERVESRKLAGAVEVILLVEQKVGIAHLTGEEGATGTADVLIISIWLDGSATLDVVDLKFGRGVVVTPDNNEQLMIYASGAVEEHGLVYDIQELCLVIHQPRIQREPSEWVLSATDLQAFEQEAKDAAALAKIAAQHVNNWVGDPSSSGYLAPGDKQCQWCGDKAGCPALAEFVENKTGIDFDNLDNPAMTEGLRENYIKNDPGLHNKMAAVDLVERWCKAVRAEVESRLLQGREVPGYKLVQGRRGARAWNSVEEAEALLKSMRLKQAEMYDFKLISPTTAEKVLKDSPKRWNRVAPLITQSEGKPSVAPESDKRPALVIGAVEDDFEQVADDLVG